MSTEIEEIIKQIAVRHGIAIGRDDPIMVLQTINMILLNDAKTAQTEILNAFKSELEDAASRWDQAANDKAQRMLNASLDASKKAMKAQIDAGIETALSEIKASFVADKNSSLELIAEAGNQTKRIAFINILAAALTITAAVLVVFF